MLTTFGVLFVLTGVAFLGFVSYLRIKDKVSPVKYPGIVVLSLILGGLALVIPVRLMEGEVESHGTKIRAVAQKVGVDAEAVANLRTQVENQSATVHLVASEATKAKELSEAAANQTKRAEDRLTELNKVISEATDTLRMMKDESEFLALTVAAQNDDRPSFDRLMKIANDPQNRFAELAAQAYLTVHRAHTGPISYSGFNIPWAPGVDPSRLSFSELESIYHDAPRPLKQGILEFIWNRKDIPQADRMNFFVEVMKSDTSLMAVEYAGRYFLEGAQTKEIQSPLDVDRISLWWDKHRKDVTEK